MIWKWLLLPCPNILYCVRGRVFLELSFPRDIFLPSFSFISTVKTVFSGRNFYRSSAYQVYYFVSGSYSGNWTDYTQISNRSTMFLFLMQFGSKKTLGAGVGSQPTYVYPPSLKRVVREIIPGNLVENPDPTHARVSSMIEHKEWYLFTIEIKNLPSPKRMMAICNATFYMKWMQPLAHHKSKNTVKVKATNIPELRVSDHLVCSSGEVFAEGFSLGGKNWPLYLTVIQMFSFDFLSRFTRLTLGTLQQQNGLLPKRRQINEQKIKTVYSH